MVRMTRRDDIRQLRDSLGEDVATFGARFARSGRTVEQWEQGRRVPDRLVQRLLDDLAAGQQAEPRQTEHVSQPPA